MNSKLSLNRTLQRNQLLNNTHNQNNNVGDQAQALIQIESMDTEINHNSLDNNRGVNGDEPFEVDLTNDDGGFGNQALTENTNGSTTMVASARMATAIALFTTMLMIFTQLLYGIADAPKHQC